MDTKLISLTKGKFAIVDSEDFEWLNQWKWFFEGRYAGRRKKTNDRVIWMHRLINNTPEGFQTDHFNGKLSKSSTSGFKGVNWDKSNNKWLARIKINYKLKNLGRYSDKKIAI